MSQQFLLKSLITQFSGQHNTLTIQRPYIEFTGSVEGGLFLSQLLYWADRTSDKEGWFYKSYREWRSEIYLAQEAVSKLSKQFSKAGFLETKLRKAKGSPTLHYRILWDRLTERLSEFFSRSSQDTATISATQTMDFRNSDNGLPQTPKSISADLDNGFPQNRKLISADRDNPLTYTSTTTSPTYIDYEQEERAREVFEAGIEVFSEPCPETLDRGDEKTIPTGAAQISREANIRPVGVLEKQFGCHSSSDPDYARFKGIYMQICAVVDGNYGNHAAAQYAWQDFRDEVGAVPGVFWDGLEAYRHQKVKQFQSEGRAIGVKGAANWLRDREWEFALQRQAVLKQAQEAGIDLQDPKSVKQAESRQSDREIYEFLKGKYEKVS